LLVVWSLACGGGNSGAPSGSGSSGSSGSGSSSNRGTVNATIDGVAYNGIVNAASLTNGNLNVASNSADLRVSIAFALSNAAVGTTTVSIQSALSMAVVTTTGTTTIGNWNAGGTFGSGSLTISSLTSSRVSGSFSFNAVAVPGASGGATGTKVVTNGTFTANF
jgi:hypothetical protein